MLLNVDVSDGVDFLTVQKAVIPGEKFCVLAFDLSHRNCIFVKFLVVLDGSLVQFIQFFALIVDWGAYKQRARVFFITSKTAQVKEFGSIQVEILGFIRISRCRLQISFRQCAVNSGVFGFCDRS